MKELPRNPSVNPAAERAPGPRHTEPDLEKAIDDETKLRSDKPVDEKADKPHHH